MRRRYLVLAAVAAVAATFAAQASPAAAAPTRGAHADCWIEDGGIFNAVERLVSSTSPARGKETREPAVSEVLDEAPSGQQGTGSSFAATIPVHWHVVSDGTNGNVRDSLINRQLNVLNAGFAGFEGGFAAGFAFTLASVDRTVNADWYNAGPGSPDERAMKAALRQGGANALNVYSTSGEAFLGWATFPSSYEEHAYLDGVVIDYRSMPGGPYGKAFSLGKTLTHEVGHWLGLYHTFQGGCNNWGDYVDDTPFQRTPTSGCPVGKDTCPEPGLDPIHNYMDYSHDSCYSEFTADQAARMQDQYLFFRA
jgi:hypothetical protein